MKKYYKILIVVILLFNIACNDWLDVEPSNLVTEDQLYSTGNGYRTNINGLYQKMGAISLYGANLSFGFIDVLSYQYDLSEDNIYGDYFRYVENRDYTVDYIDGYALGIWQSAYTIIANANNIIQNVQESTDDIFEYGELERNMVWGEALAVRALLHFDLLRVFAPAPINDDNGNYIPYSDIYPNLRPEETTLTECLDKVIADLEKAQELTMSYDTTANGISACCDKEGRFLEEPSSNTTLGGDDGYSVNSFFKFRGYRLNYYAITALLARVYQYADRHDDALLCAEKIINTEFEFDYYSGKMFDFDLDGTYHSEKLSTYDDVVEAWENKSNLKLLDNLIFACYNDGLEDNGVWQYFRKSLENSGGSVSGASYLVPDVDNQKIFFNSDNKDESGDDHRSKYLLFYANNGEYTVSGKWFIHESESGLEYNFRILPVIRLTEMYYIAAESYARKGEFVQAQNLLTKVRTERSCSYEISISDLSDFKEELIIDARREWISEGQLFFLYKRLDYPVDRANGQDYTSLSRTEAVIPVPENQSL